MSDREHGYRIPSKPYVPPEREQIAGVPVSPQPQPLVERQVEALVNKLLSLEVTREEIAAILTAAAEPYIDPEPG
jgi:hypothetical protein